MAEFAHLYSRKDPTGEKKHVAGGREKLKCNSSSGQGGRKREESSGVSNRRLARLGNKLDTGVRDRKEFKMGQKSLAGETARLPQTELQKEQVCWKDEID